jgi:hypothetical protein
MWGVGGKAQWQIEELSVDAETVRLLDRSGSPEGLSHVEPFLDAHEGHCKAVASS